MLISGLPLYSNAKDPEFGLAEQPQTFSPPASLRLLLQKVVLEHPQIKNQLQAMQVAGMDILIAEQAFWPTPSVALERVQTPSTDPAYAGSPQVLSFKLQQPVWTGGRLTAQSNKALASQQIEMARLAEIQQILGLKTLQDWVEVAIAQRQQLVLTNSEKTQTLLMTKMNRRVEAGLSSHSEAHHTQLRLLQVAQEIVNAQQRESLAWIRLQQWVPDAKKNPQDEDVIDLNAANALPELVAAQFTRASSTQWVEWSQDRSPSLKRLAQVMNLHKAELDEKRAALHPEVYVRLEHQRGNFAYANLPSSNRLVVGLTASTGAGLSLTHQLTSLEIKRNSTLEEIAAAQRLVIEAVQTDYVTAIARQSKALALRLNLELTQEQQAAWERQFNNGKKTWIDVMTATRETTQAELAVIDNDMALLHSLWRLQIQAYGVLPWMAP